MGSHSVQEKNFDFMIIGGKPLKQSFTKKNNDKVWKIQGGTAGNTVAGRLAENPSVSVLVVEAGPGNPHDEAMITTPARAMELRNSKYDWGQ